MQLRRMWIGSCRLQLPSHPELSTRSLVASACTRSSSFPSFISSPTLDTQPAVTPSTHLAFWRRIGYGVRFIVEFSFYCPHVHHLARARVRRSPWTLGVRGLIRPMAMSLRPLDSPHCVRGCVCLVTPPFFFLVSFNRNGSLEPHIFDPHGSSLPRFRFTTYGICRYVDTWTRYVVSSRGTPTSGADADNEAFVAVSMPTTTRCRSSAVRPQLSGSLRSSLWTPYFREISTLSLERDCFATAGRATLIRSSQLSATSSRKPSIEMMRKLQPRLPVFSLTSHC